MKATNSTILTIMNVLFWIIFIGLCIKTGAILVSFLVSIFVNSEGAKDLYFGLNLFELYSYNIQYYVFIVSMILVVTGLKTYISYLIVKIFMKFKLSKPFGLELTNLFLGISYSSMITGIIAVFADGFCKWIMKKGVTLPIEWGGDEILFFAGVIYILALVYKKGTDLQTENELTV